jgi:4-hydroxy-2-oxoheptanedioate aldolase
MRDEKLQTTTSARRLPWALGLTVIVWAALTSWPAAQQGTSVRLNRAIEQFEKGEAAIGNEHWRTISLEHNPFMIDDLETALNEFEQQGAGQPRVTPIVRINHEADESFHHVVKQMLDAGAFGIVLPQVRSAAQVAALVRAMRYPPQRGAQYPDPRGRRGWGPSGATRVWDLSADEYARRADVWPLNPEGELLAIIMCETRECLANIDEILEVPGLGAMMIGSADLSLALGVGTPGANGGAPEVAAAVRTLGEACMRHNVPCGIGTGSSLSTSPDMILAGLPQ